LQTPSHGAAFKDQATTMQPETCSLQTAQVAKAVSFLPTKTTDARIYVFSSLVGFSFFGLFLAFLPDLKSLIFLFFK
jgi:hypothetical protein